MPIEGMTTGGSEAMYEIARLRKGEKTPAKDKDGKDILVPVERPWFVVGSWKGDEATRSANKMRWFDVFGDKPTRIRCQLAYNTLQENAFAWLTIYRGGGMLGMSDGLRWNYLRDPHTLQVVIKDYQITEHGVERGVTTIDHDPFKPVYKTSKEYFVVPELRLYVRFPEVYGAYGMFQVNTGRGKDIRQIVGTLKRIHEDALRFKIPASEIGIILERGEDTDMYVDKGKLKSKNVHPVILRLEDTWNDLIARLGRAYTIMAMAPMLQSVQEGVFVTAEQISGFLEQSTGESYEDEENIPTKNLPSSPAIPAGGDLGISTPPVVLGTPSLGVVSNPQVPQPLIDKLSASTGADAGVVSGAILASKVVKPSSSVRELTRYLKIFLEIKSQEADIQKAAEMADTQFGEGK